MDLDVIADCFVVTVVGGLGSLPGAALASVLIGLARSFGILVFPKVTLVTAFLLMAVVLVVRPYGLLGRPEAPQPPPAASIRTLRPWRALERTLAGLALAALAALPFVADGYTLRVVTEILVLALFAFSLNLLIGTGGLVSFGHAAYFGLGAYGAALATRGLGLPMAAGAAAGRARSPPPARRCSGSSSCAAPASTSPC